MGAGSDFLQVLANAWDNGVLLLDASAGVFWAFPLIL